MTAKLELRAFLELNEGMALRYVLDRLHEVEGAWDEPEERAEHMRLLLEVLDWSQAHSSAAVRRLSALGERIPEAPTYHQFMSLVAPIERAYGRGVTDAEISARSADREEAAAEKLPLVLIVDNLRSAFNVGSIFRIAECFGVAHLYLCGYTATPEQEKLQKSAMGTSELVSWSWHARAVEVLEDLKHKGYHLYALETSDSAVSLDAFAFPKENTALIFGNERYGLESDLLRLCEAVVEIPCQGRKNSLNVAVSLGVAVHEWRRQYSML